MTEQKLDYDKKYIHFSHQHEDQIGRVWRKHCRW